MLWLTRHEGHHSLTASLASIVHKTFITQFLNTALLMLVLNSGLQIFRDQIPGDHYANINAAWHAKSSQGAQLITVMALNFATAPVISVVTLVLVPSVKRRYLHAKAMTQNALNALHMPPDMPLSSAYAELLLGAGVTLLYGTGSPLLYWVAAVGFGVKYAVHKWLFLKVTLDPPLTDPALFDNLIPVRVVSRVVVSLDLATRPGLALHFSFLRAALCKSESE